MQLNWFEARAACLETKVLFCGLRVMERYALNLIKKTVCLGIDDSSNIRSIKYFCRKDFFNNFQYTGILLNNAIIQMFYLMVLLSIKISSFRLILLRNKLITRVSIYLLLNINLDIYVVVSRSFWKKFTMDP